MTNSKWFKMMWKKMLNDQKLVYYHKRRVKTIQNRLDDDLLQFVENVFRGIIENPAGQ